MSFYQIKLSNGQRRRKVEDKLLGWQRDKSHAQYKCLSQLQKPRMMNKKGYGYENSDSKVLTQLRQSFESKCDLYFNKMRFNKLGRRDKHALKERIDFEPEVNPVLKMFATLNKRMVEPVIREGLEKILERAESRPMVYW